MTTALRPRRRPEYRAFPNLAHRNAIQRGLEVPALVRLLCLPRGGRLLEVGCGRGVALPALAARCTPARLVGLELDAGLAAEARRRDAVAEIVVGDVRRLPFPASSFDLVVDFGTCYHITGADRALAEIERVLVPGGLFAHETRLAQLLAHPARSLTRTLPWVAAPALVRHRHAGLWATRRRL
jgi:ubiquinone/menaquinone biosynthesis C-methylase UbiE